MGDLFDGSDRRHNIGKRNREKKTRKTTTTTTEKKKKRIRSPEDDWPDAGAGHTKVDNSPSESRATRSPSLDELPIRTLRDGRST